MAKDEIKTGAVNTGAKENETLPTDAGKGEGKSVAPPSKEALAKTTAIVEVAKLEEHVEHIVEEADPKHAGLYEVVHGSYRVGDKYVGKGSKIRLGAHDGKLGSLAGTLKKVAD
jgi:hypothetical protein